MTPPEGDELRIRAYLRALGARPFGHPHKRTPMSDARTPITPTRVIPAGADLPARPPQPGEQPPWRTPPPPPPAPPAARPPDLWPPAPDPGEVVVRHVHEILIVPPEPDPPRLWERLWDALVTWRMVVAILAALIPWVHGRSPVGLWGHTVHQARTEAGVPAAYIIASVAVTAAWVLDRRTGRAVPRFLLVTATLGALGVLHWYDPITLFTGVHA